MYVSLFCWDVPKWESDDKELEVEPKSVQQNVDVKLGAIQFTEFQEEQRVDARAILGILYHCRLGNVSLNFQP
jgi:hypothetical protein